MWVSDEAAKIISRITDHTKPVIFETGYGPSGLPHIGTFTEVARTSWVRHAFTEMHNRPTRLIAFSDDMDGMRRVPENVPNQEMMRNYIGMPLTKVPDPFNTHESFAHHNNAKLCEFLDRFGFDYEFASSTNYYKSGMFNEALKKVLINHDEIIETILPTLGKERASNYSPLMPIHPRTGQVMQVNIEQVDPSIGTLVWCHDGEWFETSVYDGNCKLQWKADWAMRWYALGVDYEMSGKDLIDSVKLSGKICQILGGVPPINLTYELFLDEKGQKISKSKGNGLSVEDWLKYGPQESLAYYIFSNPQRAKKLYFELIPRATDEYLQNIGKLASQKPVERLDNPTWYIHTGKINNISTPIGYGMLLNLAGVANTEDPNVLMQYILRYDSSTVETPFLTKMILNAISYYQDFIKPKKVFRNPTELEREVLLDMVAVLKTMEEGTTSDIIQVEVFAVGKKFPVMKQWFDCLYQVLLGQNDGPRFGVFIALYGIKNTIDLIESKLV